MPVTCPQVLCPHPCLTPTRLLSAPTGLFLLYPRAYLLEARSAPPLHKLNGSPHPSPDLSALPTSSLCCSLECPPLLLPCLSPLSPSPLFSALSFSFPLLSLFLPPTDRLQQEQPCTPSPGRPFPWIWAQYKQPRTPHLQPGLGSRVGWADEVIATGPPAGQQACEGKKCLFGLVSLATCWTPPPLPSLSRPAKLRIGPLPFSRPDLAVLRPWAMILSCQEGPVTLNPTSRDRGWKMEARPTLPRAEDHPKAPPAVPG